MHHLFSRISFHMDQGSIAYDIGYLIRTQHLYLEYKR